MRNSRFKNKSLKFYQYKYARKNLDENNATVKHLFEKEINVKIDECEVLVIPTGKN